MYHRRRRSWRGSLLGIRDIDYLCAARTVFINFRPNNGWTSLIDGFSSRTVQKSSLFMILSIFNVWAIFDLSKCTIDLSNKFQDSWNPYQMELIRVARAIVTSDSFWHLNIKVLIHIRLIFVWKLECYISCLILL